MEALGETNPIRVLYTRFGLSKSIDANCLPSDHPSWLSTRSRLSNYIGRNASPPSLSGSPSLCRCRTPFPRNFWWKIASTINADRSTNWDYIGGSLEALADKSQITRASRATKFTVYEFISKLGNCRISINNWCALRASSFGASKKYGQAFSIR